ncbi:MAG TPA: Uma2 family endonuclease [Candidatus Elarobacter sp.]|jgi:Uma2 family endonuclease
MSIHEIVLPETKPETEWILGRAVRKVSPRRTHSWLQRELVLALAAWARGRGHVGAEWRFRVAPPGEIRRPLVPDVAYVADERLRGLHGYDLEIPPFAPDVAVEILSPGDRSRSVEHKIGVYLASGASLVMVVDPRHRTVAVHDARGARVLGDADTVTHDALPGFSLSVRELFAAADYGS